MSNVFLDHYAKEIGIVVRSSTAQSIQEEQAIDVKPVVQKETKKNSVYQADLNQLRPQALVCDACALCKERQKVVFGVGNPQADVMFIGEAPAQDEEQCGEAFRGRTAQLFDAMLQAIGRQREQVYMSHVVLCRPPEDRQPTHEEGQQCRYWLEAQWQAVQPRVVCLMGKVAMQHVLGETGNLASMRGQWFEHLNTKVMVTYHPAHLLRAPSHKAMAWEDMQRLMRELKRHT